MDELNDLIFSTESEKAFWVRHQYGEEAMNFFPTLEKMLKMKEENTTKAVNNNNFINFSNLLPPWKFFCKNLKISQKRHKERNALQHGLAPETMEQANVMVSLGLFYKLKHTASHNMKKEDDSPDGRWKWFCILDRDLGNLDYRGSINTPFEGVQLIYNEKNKQLVCDNLNKGTVDFVSPLRSFLGHFEYDIKPWILYGNMGPDKKENLLMSKNKWKTIETYYKQHLKNKISLDECKSEIINLFK
jgi:hypothetical protein